MPGVHSVSLGPETKRALFTAFPIMYTCIGVKEWESVRGQTGQRCVQKSC